MNIASDLPQPLDSFILDVPAHQYYDFELSSDSSYPLKGVTYSVDYGHLDGYTGEDGHELDLFTGSSLHGRCGTIEVSRGANIPNEHKFYVALTGEEINGILGQLRPVLISHEELHDIDELLEQINEFKDKQ